MLSDGALPAARSARSARSSLGEKASGGEVGEGEAATAAAELRPAFVHAAASLRLQSTLQRNKPCDARGGVGAAACVFARCCCCFDPAFGDVTPFDGPPLRLPLFAFAPAAVACALLLAALALLAFELVRRFSPGAPAAAALDFVGLLSDDGATAAGGRRLGACATAA